MRKSFYSTTLKSYSYNVYNKPEKQPINSEMIRLGFQIKKLLQSLEMGPIQGQ